MTYRTSLLCMCLFGAGLAASVSARQAAPAAAATTTAPAPTVLDLRRMQPIQGDAKVGAGKAAVCAACHGAQGVAIAPNFPNLAGQSATYLYVQLKQFHDGTRSDPVMSGQVTALDDTDMRNLAAYYASLAPKPTGSVDATSRGAQLYLSGDPAQGAPPCQGCHGPAGQGPQVHPTTAPQPPWSTFPRLHGEGALYVTKALGDFKSGARAGSTNAKVMQGVVQNLSDADIQALSAYIATQ